jgi:hypothetical protein
MAEALHMATSVALRAGPPSSCIPRSQATGQRKCTAGHIASRCICICYATLLSCPLMFTHCSVDRWPTPLSSSASPMSPPGLRARQHHLPAHNHDDGDATVGRPFAGGPHSLSIASGMSVTIQLQPAHVQAFSRGIAEDHGQGVTVTVVTTALLGVAEDHDDGVAAEEHFADKAVLVHRLRRLLALACLWDLHTRTPRLLGRVATFMCRSIAGGAGAAGNVAG